MIGGAIEISTAESNTAEVVKPSESGESEIRAQNEQRIDEILTQFDDRFRIRGETPSGERYIVCKPNSGGDTSLVLTTRGAFVIKNHQRLELKNGTTIDSILSTISSPDYDERELTARGKTGSKYVNLTPEEVNIDMTKLRGSEADYLRRNGVSVLRLGDKMDEESLGQVWDAHIHQAERFGASDR